MSVFVDLSVLFPRSTSATVFHLVSQPEGEGSRLDGLRFHGGARLRNGSGASEVLLVSASTPVAGEEWQAWVGVSPEASATLVVVTDQPLAGRESPFGEILIDVFSSRPLFRSLVSSKGGTDVHALAIPPAALGLSFSLQALILGEPGIALTNAVDIVVGP